MRIVLKKGIAKIEKSNRERYRFYTYIQRHGSIPSLKQKIHPCVQEWTFAKSKYELTESYYRH